MPDKRTLTDHVITQADAKLRITVEDEPGSGGACHRYAVRGFNASSNPSLDADRLLADASLALLVLFQNGPVREGGPNGITVEALLAICMDRLRSFQAGPFPSKANACALTKIEEAMHWLQQRTIERMRRGVEGKEVA